MAAKRRRPDQVGDLLRHHDGFPGSRRARRVHRRGAAERARGEDEQARLSRRQRDGDDVQHAARQRPDLVVRGEQLPARQRSVPVRPAVLERRFDAHAGAACTASICARCIRRTCWRSRAASAWRACRSTCGKIKTPAYFLSTREDHIAPWKSTYRGTQLLGGPKRFVLAASGHIAGVVNPPDGGKYSHWINHGPAARSRRVVQGRDRDRRFLVAGLASLGQRARQGAGAGARCPATAS